MRQYLKTIRRHEHVVFDSDASPTGKIDSRLDGKHHPGLENRIGVLPDGRSFVNLQADAVPQSMAKKLAEARLSDNGPSLGIDVSRFHPGTNGPERLLLRLQDHSVHLLQFRRYPTARENTRQVAIVEAAH